MYSEIVRYARISEFVIRLAAFVCGGVILAMTFQPTLAADASSTTSAPTTVMQRPPPIMVRPTAQRLKAYGQLLMEAIPHRSSVSGTGAHCYSAHYPSTALQEIPCLPKSKAINMIHKLHYNPTTAPQTVGDGTDYFARLTNGTATGAIGSFSTVNVKSENGINSATSKQQGNVYSIQINPNDYTSGLCFTQSGCSNATIQFVYSTTQCPGGRACLVIEYWLLNASKSSCPPNWDYYDGSLGGIPGCYLNVDSPSQLISWADLQTTQFIALATSERDYFLLLAADGSTVIAQAPSDGLSVGRWTSTEFNLVGDGNSTEATFYNGTSTLGLNLAVQFQQSASANSAASLSCSSFPDGGVSTGETNNLTLGPCLVSGNSMQFSESGGVPAPAAPPPLSCAQILADIAIDQKIITSLANSPPSCPTNIVGECVSQLRGAEALLADLRFTYTAQHCKPPL